MPVAPVALEKMKIHLDGWWSDLFMNYVPSRYGCMRRETQITARFSQCMVFRLVSSSPNVCDQYPIYRPFPFLIPKPDAIDLKAAFVSVQCRLIFAFDLCESWPWDQIFLFRTSSAFNSSSFKGPIFFSWALLCFLEIVDAISAELGTIRLTTL